MHKPGGSSHAVIDQDEPERASVIWGAIPASVIATPGYRVMQDATTTP